MPIAWLELLKLEVGSILEDEFIEPDIELDEEFDHPVGEADEDLRRLFTKWRQLIEAADRTAVDARYARNEQARQEVAAQARELFTKAQIVKELFWTCVKDSFDLWTKSAVGIRKGWIVVWSEEEESSITGLLRRSFGDPPS